MHEKVALEHSSKSTKYELEGSYGDPVHEHFCFLKTAKLPRECNEVTLHAMRRIHGTCKIKRGHVYYLIAPDRKPHSKDGPATCCCSPLFITMHGLISR